MAFRTQKISQMTPKGADLEATDLIEVSTIESGSYVTRSITGQELIDAIPLPPTGLSVGTTPIASGTIGRVLFQGTGNVLQQSSSLAYDDTTKAFTLSGSIGSGSAVRNSVTNTSNSGFADFFAFNDTGRYLGAQIGGSAATGTFANISNANISKIVTNNPFVIGTQNTNPLIFAVGASVATGEVARFSASTGNFLINTTTDAGFRLDVNGTARVQGSTTIAASSNFGLNITRSGTSGIAEQIYNSAGTTYLGADSSAGAFLFTNGLPYASFFGNGANYPTQFGTNGAIRMTIFAGGNVGINTTTDDGFRLDVNGAARVSGLVTATLSNYNSTHSGNTTRGFYIVNSADSIVRGGIEYDGANAFVQLAGRYNNGAAFFRQDGSNGNISFLRTGVELGRIFGATGNWGINTTTDAGFRLDVNGTARVKTTDSSTPLNVAHSGSVGIQVEANANGYRLRLASSNTVASITTPDSYLSINSGGQLVVIGSTSTYNSAQVAIDSTTKGFLPPRMTTTQKNAIATPATGLQVYDTTLNQMSYYNGTTWTNI